MRKRLRFFVIAFCVSFAFVAVLSLYGLKQFTTLTGYSDQVDYAHQIISRLNELESHINEIEIGEREYMLTRDSTKVQELFQAYHRLLMSTETLKSFFTDNREQSAALTHLRVALYQRINAVRDNLTYIDSAAVGATQPLISGHYQHGKTARAESIQYLNQMRNRENGRLSEYFKNETTFQETAYTLLQYLLIVFSILTIILFLFLLRELKKRVRFQDELQAKMAETKRSRAELQQIAYAVSHDLQEPLRKIQIFSHRLLYTRKDFDDDSNMSLERIHSSALRMNGLITDLANLTGLVREKNKEYVNLNDILEAVLDELQEGILEKQIQVSADALPELYGHARQLHLLFKCLLDNAIKFSNSEQGSFVAIRYEKTSGKELKELDPAVEKKQFYLISIADNGIGFDNRFTGKIFKLFQRLHSQQSDYPGKGVGLAICQRVMVNHAGYILAFGHVDIGATFKLFFPAEK